MIRVTAYNWVPPFAQGLVRDLRVRWALEELGLRYETKLIGFEDRDSSAYRRIQPFGQVPVYEEETDGGETLTLFESGAIVLHIGERSETLLPADPAARAGPEKERSTSARCDGWRKTPHCSHGKASACSSSSWSAIGRIRRSASGCLKGSAATGAGTANLPVAANSSSASEASAGR